jgi:hypothetical protein
VDAKRGVVIEFSDGQSFELVALDQSLTYVDWDEGGPTRGWNTRMVDRVVGEVELRWGVRPHVIPGRERVWGDSSHRRGDDAVRARFADVTCRALFVSRGTGRRRTVVWFQDAWALPVDGGVISALRALDPS